jgi:hypothetical protein
VELAALIVSVVAALGTWIQIAIQWSKDRQTETPPSSSSSAFMVRRKSALGIVFALVVWSAATGYLAYRVIVMERVSTQAKKQSTDSRQQVIADFASNRWVLLRDKQSGNLSAVVDVVTATLVPRLLIFASSASLESMITRRTSTPINASIGVPSF